ncbi:MAG: hypothetical protein JWO67_4530 [Streptosporangiaceae bacterium]|nr:hypothetical protein [Streptosporangiaceae bacterium]
MSETTIATGNDVHGLRWQVQRYDEPGFTEYYLEFGGQSIVLNDMIVAALEALPELD